MTGIPHVPIPLPGDELEMGDGEGNLGSTQTNPAASSRNAALDWSREKLSRLPKPDCLREKPGWPKEGS